MREAKPEGQWGAGRASDIVHSCAQCLSVLPHTPRGLRLFPTSHLIIIPLLHFIPDTHPDNTAYRFLHKHLKSLIYSIRRSVHHVRH